MFGSQIMRVYEEGDVRNARTHTLAISLTHNTQTQLSERISLSSDLFAKRLNRFMGSESLSS